MAYDDHPPADARTAFNLVWETGTLQWVKETQPSGGSGGGAVTIADGADTAEGTTSDAAWGGTGSGTVISLLKGLESDITSGPTTLSNGSGGPITVNAPGGGTVFFVCSGTATGTLGFQEQITSGGSFINASGFIIAGSLTDPTQTYRRFNGVVNCNLGTVFILAIETHGLAVKITNSVSTGSLSVSAIFKRAYTGTKPSILGGPQNGFTAEVNSHNELTVSLVNHDDNSISQWIGMPVGDATAVPGGRQSWFNSVTPFVFNETNWDRLRGNKTSGMFVGQALPPNYINNYKANTYSGGMGLTSINSSTFTTGTLTASCTPIIGVWNPSSSAVNLVILRATLALAMTNLQNTGGGPYVWALSTGNVSGSPAGNAPLNRKTLANSGATGKDVCGVALTNLTTNLAVVFGSSLGGGSAYNTALLGTAAGFQNTLAGSEERFDGSLIVPPGGVLALLATTTPVAHSAVSSIEWLEVPV